jgi:pimeloyl-ACP methyl ester carboxylesterase
MRPLSVVVALLFLSPACGGSGETPAAEQGGGTTSAVGTTATATTTELAAPCGDEAAEAVALRTAEGSQFDAALVGEGDVGIVFGHQFGRDWCSWLPFGKRAARGGMRVLSVNFPQAARTDAYMEAAAEELRRLGSSRIILVGASMGAAGALVAAPRVEGLVGVAGLSAPQEFEGVNALPAVENIDVPVIFIVAKGDGDLPHEAERLFEATRSQDKKLVVTEGLEHGTSLLRDRQARRVLSAFLDAVSRT